jgi:hypothetical protein
MFTRIEPYVGIKRSRIFLKLTGMRKIEFGASVLCHIGAFSYVEHPWPRAHMRQQRVLLLHMKCMRCVSPFIPLIFDTVQHLLSTPTGQGASRTRQLVPIQFHLMPTHGDRINSTRDTQ